LDRHVRKFISVVHSSKLMCGMSFVVTRHARDSPGGQLGESAP
jgi:hypothetical protein